MPGQGLQIIPFRIPEKWDAAWYARHLKEVLALADTRNALEGSGIVITGQPGEVATISTSEDLTNLLLQSFVVATPSGFLNFERVLTEGDAIELIDGGANSTLTIGIPDEAITLGKLTPLAGNVVLGNPSPLGGIVQQIFASGLGEVLHHDGTNITFDLIDHTYVSDFDEATQDVVGLMAGDTASIVFSYDDGTGILTADVVDSYIEDLATGAFAAVTLLTQADETADFPASRRLVSGTNISFNIATPGQFIISSTGGGGGGGGYPPALGHSGW